MEGRNNKQYLILTARKLRVLKDNQRLPKRWNWHGEGLSPAGLYGWYNTTCRLDIGTLNRPGVASAVLQTRPPIIDFSFAFGYRKIMIMFPTSKAHRNILQNYF